MNKKQFDLLITNELKAIETPENIKDKVHNQITYTLRNKRKNNHFFKRFIIAIVSVLTTIVGTFGVYAATGGTIEGIPATDWLGIKFSDKYVEYKQPVENQIIAFKDTSVELSSTICNEGITILEFNLKLSEEDYKKLGLGKSILTDEYLQKQEEIKTKVTDEKQLARIEADIEERRNTSFIPALSLNYNQVGGTYNYDKFNPNTTWYASIYINDIPYYVKNWQKIQQISDYEYKIYTMYALDDDVLEGKEEFEITLKNNKLVNIINWKSYNNTWRNSCQWFASNNDSEQMGTPPNIVMDLSGEFEVSVSKNNVLKDSIVIENLDIKSEFRNITQTVEKVVVSPIQTIVKINHSAVQQSSNAYGNRYDDPNIEHLPITRTYKAYDANGNELSCFSMSNKSTLIYSNGEREDYPAGELPNKKYSNATWEKIQYLLIENTDTDYIKIVPVETVMNPLDGVEANGGETYYEMDPLIINLK